MPEQETKFDIIAWLDKLKWLKYSKSPKEAYCTSCCKNVNYVNGGFWQVVRHSKGVSHINSETHQTTLRVSPSGKLVVANEDVSVSDKFSTHEQQQVSEMLLLFLQHTRTSVIVLSGN
jgi:hypothetical protein